MGLKLRSRQRGVSSGTVRYALATHLDIRNTGNKEERRVGGWRERMSCFYTSDIPQVNQAQPNITALRLRLASYVDRTGTASGGNSFLTACCVVLSLRGLPQEISVHQLSPGGCVR
jgi:hypothetical protein